MAGLTKRKYTYVDFTKQSPAPLFAQTTNAIATAADNQVDYFKLGDHYFEHIQTGANAAIQYITSANGWVIPVDGTDGDAIELTQGIMAARDLSFTVGTDAAFFFQCCFKVGTVAAQDVYGCGFRKQGSYVDITTPSLLASVYDDKCGVFGNSVAGNLVQITSIAGTDTTTELTHADVADATWVCIRNMVSAAGVFTFQLGTSLVSANAAEAALAVDASAAAMTVANAIILTPYFPTVSTGTLGDIQLVRWECGYQ